MFLPTVNCNSSVKFAVTVGILKILVSASSFLAADSAGYMLPGHSAMLL
jgi:hypothetical protein